MGYRRYTAQYKAKIVLEVLQGEKEFGEIAAENNLNPNMLRSWKKEFLENASAAFEDPRKAEKEAKKKETAQRRGTARMLKTIGHLTLVPGVICHLIDNDPMEKHERYLAA